MSSKSQERLVVAPAPSWIATGPCTTKVPTSTLKSFSI